MFINWSLPIVLVEGAFDAIAVRRNVIPLFGKTISEDLRKKIIENKVNQVYICLDKDAQKQALEHAEYFMNNGVQVYFVDLQEKLKNKLLREGDRIKSWALANKFKQKKPKK